MGSIETNDIKTEAPDHVEAVLDTGQPPLDSPMVNHSRTENQRE